MFARVVIFSKVITTNYTSLANYRCWIPSNICDPVQIVSWVWKTCAVSMVSDGFQLVSTSWRNSAMDLLKVTYTPEINGWNPRPWFPKTNFVWGGFFNATFYGMWFQWIHLATLKYIEINRGASSLKTIQTKTSHRSGKWGAWKMSLVSKTCNFPLPWFVWERVLSSWWFQLIFSILDPRLIELLNIYLFIFARVPWHPVLSLTLHKFTVYKYIFVFTKICYHQIQINFSCFTFCLWWIHGAQPTTGFRLQAIPVRWFFWLPWGGRSKLVFPKWYGLHVYTVSKAKKFQKEKLDWFFWKDMMIFSFQQHVRLKDECGIWSQWQMDRYFNMKTWSWNKLLGHTTA